MIPALIMVTTLATSSTGGNSAGPGVVVHEGASYSSAVVQTVTGGSGTTTVNIETNVNGQTQSVHKVLPPASSPTVVEVRAQAPVVQNVRAATSASSGTTSTSSVPLAPHGWVAQFVAAVQNFIRSIFGFVR